MKISDISNDYKMATYYPSTSAQIDVLSAPYVRDQKFTSYSEPPPLLHGTMMMYLNPASSTGSFTDVSPGSSMNPQNEMMFIPPTGDSMCVQTMNGAINPEIGQRIGDGDQQSLQGLSLSLRTQMSSAVSSASFQYQYSNPGLSSVLSPHLPLSAENGVRPMGCKIDEVWPSSKELRNSDYFPYDMDGDGPNTIRFGEGNNNEQYEMNIKVMNMNQYQYEQDGIASTIMKSKYLKAAQQLLDEVVNVRDSLKRSESNKDKNGVKAEEGGSQPASETNKSTAGSGSSHELSQTERQELQGKLDKLHSMLDEVDRRYKQYCQQMQIIVSSFDMVVGNGASKPYTALALKTISRHFRCLRDAIVGQIQSRRKSLGEQDNGLGAIPRLRYVDQQLRQQRSLHQFGMMRHAWRPQRGLPENAVTILRAWLFEHFLHPYPKDSEKIMLARQTGLTRSQVGNWFINARVRLWKPMVEEMYKEEFGEEKIKTRSPEHTPKFSREKSWGSEDRRDQEMHETTTSMTTNQDVHDSSNTNPNPGSDTKGFTSSSTPGFQIGLFTDSENHGFYPNPSISHDPDGGAHLMVPYQIPELGNFNVDNTTQVSLALGLRHREGESNTTMGVGTSEFSYIEQVNQHILNDFVA